MHFLIILILHKRALHYHIGYQDILTHGANIEINKRIQNKRMKSMECVLAITPGSMLVSYESGAIYRSIVDLRVSAVISTFYVIL
jgi:hypothetical protein